MDIRLHYREAGSGPALLLLHGNGEDGTYFHHQMDFFSAQYRVIAVDTRGHGASPRGQAPFTIGQFATDLRGLLQQLGVEKAHILGFSDGGNIAMVFAMRYPQLVDRLILNGANLHGSGVKAAVQLPIVLGYHICKRLKGPAARKKAELLGLMVNEPSLAPSMLSQITAKTLVVAGKRDMIKQCHTELIASSIPGARMELLPGDHFIAKRSPQAFNRLVDAFLKEPTICT